MANWTPTPTSGAISAQDINEVASKSSTAQVSFSNLYTNGNHWSFQFAANSAGVTTITAGDSFIRIQRRQDATSTNGGGTITTNNNYNALVYKNFNVANQRVASSMYMVPGGFSQTSGNDISLYYTNYSSTQDSNKMGTNGWHFFMGQNMFTGSYGSWNNYASVAKGPLDRSYRVAYDHYRVYIREGTTRLPVSGAISFFDMLRMG